METEMEMQVEKLEGVKLEAWERAQLLEIYPTGRKHCSKCGRWRYLSGFGVRRYFDRGGGRVGEARTLQSRCRVCQARIERGASGPEGAKRWGERKYRDSAEAKRA